MSSTKAARRASTHNRFPIGEGFEFTGHRDTRWCVGRQIGEGTFSYVFELRRVDKDKRVAIKFAKLPRGRPDRAATRAALFAEFEKIRLIAPLVNNGEHPMIASAYEFGEVLVPFDGEESVKCAFVIMPLLGPSLSDIRKQGNVLSASCVCKLSERVLQCLRALHVNGFLHLDEKPSNWVVPLPKSRTALSSHSELLELISRTLLIDLGNSRHLDPPPLSDPSNPNAGLVSISSEFLGSSRHTSSHTDLGAHAQQGYGRRDDLLSWWNAVLSLLSDQVPPWHFFADLTASDHLARRLGHVVTGLFKRAWYQLAAADVASVIDIERSNPRHVAAFREFSGALALLLPLSADAAPDYDALNKHLVCMRQHLNDALNSEIHAALFEESPFQLAWSSFGIAKACTKTWEALNTTPLAEAFASESEQTRIRAHAALMERQHPVLRDCNDNTVLAVPQTGLFSVQLDATPVFPVLMEAVVSQSLSIGTADATEADAHSVEITSPPPSVQFNSIPCSISPAPSIETATTPSAADILIDDCREEVSSSAAVDSTSSTCPEPEPNLKTSKPELPQPKPEPAKPLLNPSNELLPEFGPLPVPVAAVLPTRAGPTPASSKPEMEEGEIEVPTRSIVKVERIHSNRSRHHESSRADASHASRVSNSSSTSATLPRSPVANSQRPQNSRSSFQYEHRPERRIYPEESERYERRSDERPVYHPAHVSQHLHSPEHHSRRLSHSQPPPHHSPYDHEYHPHHSHQDYHYDARNRSPPRSSSRDHSSRPIAPSIWDRFVPSRNSTHNYAHTSAHAPVHSPVHVPVRTPAHISLPSSSRQRHYSEMAEQPTVHLSIRQYPSPSQPPPSNCISDRWRSQDADDHYSESNQAYSYREDRESAPTGYSSRRSITIFRPESER